MSKPLRRVVTGHDKDGKAIVIEDGPPPAGLTNPLRPGHISTDIWRTFASPAPIVDAEPDATQVPTKTRFPTPAGTLIRISEVPPDTTLRGIDAQQSREVFRSYGNENASTFGQGGKHPFMHRTESVDYAVVLEGEITLVLDDSEVALSTGDVVVQRGTNHAWSNRSDKPCRMLYVLIDGRFDPQLKTLLGA
ncbi:MAG: cupin domain-containing protein [Burkholderiales bacterium]